MGSSRRGVTDRDEKGHAGPAAITVTKEGKQQVRRDRAYGRRGGEHSEVVLAFRPGQGGRQKGGSQRQRCRSWKEQAASG